MRGGGRRQSGAAPPAVGHARGGNPMKMKTSSRMGLLTAAAAVALCSRPAGAAGREGPWEWPLAGFAGVEKPMRVDNFGVDANGSVIGTLFDLKSDTAAV